MKYILYRINFKNSKFILNQNMKYFWKIVEIVKMLNIFKIFWNFFLFYNVGMILNSNHNLEKIVEKLFCPSLISHKILDVMPVMRSETCVNPPDQNRVFYGYANQSIYIGFTVSMTCGSGYDWNNGVSGSTQMLANCTVSGGQAVWTTSWSCTRMLIILWKLQVYCNTRFVQLCNFYW